MSVTSSSGKNYSKSVQSKTTYVKISAPDNLDIALEGLVRRVLKEQPKADEIYSFAADYFETLVDIREKAGRKKLTVREICPFHNDEDAHELVKLATAFARPKHDKKGSEPQEKTAAEMSKSEGDVLNVIQEIPLEEQTLLNQQISEHDVQVDDTLQVQMKHNETEEAGEDETVEGDPIKTFVDLEDKMLNNLCESVPEIVEDDVETQQSNQKLVQELIEEPCTAIDAMAVSEREIREVDERREDNEVTADIVEETAEANAADITEETAEAELDAAREEAQPDETKEEDETKETKERTEMEQTVEITDANERTDAETLQKEIEDEKLQQETEMENTNDESDLKQTPEGIVIDHEQEKTKTQMEQTQEETLTESEVQQTQEETKVEIQEETVVQQTQEETLMETEVQQTQEETKVEIQEETVVQQTQEETLMETEVQQTQEETQVETEKESEVQQAQEETQMEAPEESEVQETQEETQIKTHEETEVQLTQDATEIEESEVEKLERNTEVEGTTADGEAELSNEIAPSEVIVAVAAGTEQTADLNNAEHSREGETTTHQDSQIETNVSAEEFPEINSENSSTQNNYSPSQESSIVGGDPNIDAKDENRNDEEKVEEQQNDLGLPEEIEMGTTDRDTAVIEQETKKTEDGNVEDEDINRGEGVEKEQNIGNEEKENQPQAADIVEDPTSAPSDEDSKKNADNYQVSATVENTVTRAESQLEVITENKLETTVGKEVREEDEKIEEGSEEGGDKQFDDTSRKETDDNGGGDEQEITKQEEPVMKEEKGSREANEREIAEYNESNKEPETDVIKSKENLNLDKVSTIDSEKAFQSPAVLSDDPEETLVEAQAPPYNTSIAEEGNDENTSAEGNLIDFNRNAEDILTEEENAQKSSKESLSDAAVNMTTDSSKETGSSEGETPLISVQVTTIVETQVELHHEDNDIDITIELETKESGADITEVVQAALTIQRAYRRFRARRQTNQLKEPSSIVSTDLNFDKEYTEQDHTLSNSVCTQTQIANNDLHVNQSTTESTHSTDSSLSSSATKINRSENQRKHPVRRTTELSLFETHSLDPPKKAPMVKTRSLTSIRQGVTDFEVWNTIEKELEEAATTIQSNFRGYRIRKRLKREDAVQITTTSASASSETLSSWTPRPSSATGYQHSGEFHDSVVLLIHPH